MQSLPTFVYVIAAIILFAAIVFVGLVLFAKYKNSQWNKEDNETRPFGDFDYERSVEEARRNNKYI